LTRADFELIADLLDGPLISIPAPNPVFLPAPLTTLKAKPERFDPAVARFSQPTAEPICWGWSVGWGVPPSTRRRRRPDVPKDLSVDAHGSGARVISLRRTRRISSLRCRCLTGLRRR